MENNMNINWYPGHMAKTKRQIMEDVRLVDIIIELLDARIPISSQNPDIAEITKNKKKIIVLNKCDLADERQNKRWVEYFKSKNIPAVLTDSNSGKGIEECVRKIKKIMEEELKGQAEKGRIGRKIKAMVLGIPNVGKSSFINRISKRNSATVGNRPGVTRQKQWIRINSNIELLDTPGVLWPKFQNEEIALNLAYTGTIKDDILATIEVGFSLLKYLINNDINKLKIRYKLNNNEIDKILNSDLEENEKAVEILHMIGRKRGAIISGGNVDEEKTAKIILDDFRNGKIGRITLEKA